MVQVCYPDGERLQFVMRRFPYVIFYEEFHATISIYAIAHAKRKPGYWLGRLKDMKTGDG